MLSSTYFLDTNICIYAMNAKLPVLRKFRELGLDRLAISSLVAAELAYGVEKSPRYDSNKQNLALFLADMRIVSWEAAAMWHYAKQRRRLAQAGTPIGEIDLLLGCQALALGATFVTNNTREFERIEGLKLENWVG
jgi:tRNA(fMet)-specific endonuclease VapC